MKIFLIYLVINSPQNTGYNYGLGYIASVLKNSGHKVDYIALNGEEDLPSFYEKIKCDKPGLIGFSSTTSQYSYLKDIVNKIRELSGAFIVCGGVHPTLEPDCISEIAGLDAIVRGEGEYPMLELAGALQNKTEYRDIKNIWYKHNGSVIKNAIRPPINNLDELPFPDKLSLDYQKVIDGARGMNKFIFSRGCTFQCTYCSNKALSDLYKGNVRYFRTESPKRAIEEIKADESRFIFSGIDFQDDIISLDKKWFYEFFSIYKKEFKYPSIVSIRPAVIDEDMIKLLKDAGTKKAVIGVEHGNETFRKKVLKRDMTNEDIIKTFQLFKKYEIECHGQIMVGFPFEDKRLFLDTVRLCRKLDIKPSNNISIFYPYPGTELGNICKSHNWLPKKRYYRERSDAIISYPSFSNKEIRLCTRVFPTLMANKNVSLKIPLNLIRYYFKFLSKWKVRKGSLSNEKQTS